MTKATMTKAITKKTDNFLIFYFGSKKNEFVTLSLSFTFKLTMLHTHWQPLYLTFVYSCIKSLENQLFRLSLKYYSYFPCLYLQPPWQAGSIRRPQPRTVPGLRLGERRPPSPLSQEGARRAGRLSDQGPTAGGPLHGQARRALHRQSLPDLGPRLPGASLATRQARAPARPLPRQRKCL